MIDWVDLGIFLGILAAWFVLNRWLLPWLGVPTCMSGACASAAQAEVGDAPIEEPEPLTFASPYAEPDSTGNYAGPAPETAEKAPERGPLKDS